MADTTVGIKQDDNPDRQIDAVEVTTDAGPVVRQVIAVEQVGTWSVITGTGTLATTAVSGIVAQLDVQAPIATAATMTVNGDTITIPAGSGYSTSPPYGTLVDPDISVTGSDAYTIAAVA